MRPPYPMKLKLLCCALVAVSLSGCKSPPSDNDFIHGASAQLSQLNESTMCIPLGYGARFGRTHIGPISFAYAIDPHAPGYHIDHELGELGEQQAEALREVGILLSEPTTLVSLGQTIKATRYWVNPAKADSVRLPLHGGAPCVRVGRLQIVNVAKPADAASASSDEVSRNVSIERVDTPTWYTPEMASHFPGSEIEILKATENGIPVTLVHTDGHWTAQAAAQPHKILSVPNSIADAINAHPDVAFRTIQLRLEADKAEDALMYLPSLPDTPPSWRASSKGRYLLADTLDSYKVHGYAADDMASSKVLTREIMDQLVSVGVFNKSRTGTSEPVQGTIYEITPDFAKDLRESKGSAALSLGRLKLGKLHMFATPSGNGLVRIAYTPAEAPVWLTALSEKSPYFKAILSGGFVTMDGHLQRGTGRFEPKDILDQNYSFKTTEEQ